MLQRNRRRRQHVINVVPPQQRTLHRLPHSSANKIEARPLRPQRLDVFRPHIRETLPFPLIPNITSFPLKSRPNWETYSSSAFSTAVPPCGNASISSYFARAIPAIESKLSK